MNKLRPYLLVGGIAAIGVALYRYYQRQMNFIKDVQYRVTGVKILSFTKENVSLEVTTQIFNASNVEFVIQEIDLNVYLNGINVAEVRENKDLRVAANGFSFFSFNFSFEPSKLGKDLLNIFTTSISLKDMLIDVLGRMKVRSAFVSANVPFSYRNNIRNFIKK